MIITDQSHKDTEPISDVNHPRNGQFNSRGQTQNHNAFINISIPAFLLDKEEDYHLSLAPNRHIASTRNLNELNLAIRDQEPTPFNLLRQIERLRVIFIENPGDFTLDIGSKVFGDPEHYETASNEQLSLKSDKQNHLNAKFCKIGDKLIESLTFEDFDKHVIYKDISINKDFSIFVIESESQLLISSMCRRYQIFFDHIDENLRFNTIIDIEELDAKLMELQLQETEHPTFAAHAIGFNMTQAHFERIRGTKLTNYTLSEIYFENALILLQDNDKKPDGFYVAAYRTGNETEAENHLIKIHEISHAFYEKIPAYRHKQQSLISEYLTESEQEYIIKNSVIGQHYPKKVYADEFHAYLMDPEFANKFSNATNELRSKILNLHKAMFKVFEDYCSKNIVPSEITWRK